ncbi:MAG: bifunctional nuclease family protein [Bacteroidales bacterium]|nr:bifunctional nuclease family protein [Bacteroidales bacterium]
MAYEFEYKIQLTVVSLSSAVNHPGAYTLTLKEVGGDRRLPIIIGLAEAQAIAVHLQRIVSPRPLSHDLFHNMAVAFDIKVEEVIVYACIDGIFCSKIICVRDNIRSEIDARTSDAVSIALRFGAPIYIYERILNDVTERLRTIHDNLQTVKTTQYASIDDLSVSQLQEMLDAAIKEEDYEKASDLRDELRRRGAI